MIKQIHTRLDLILGSLGLLAVLRSIQHLPCTDRGRLGVCRDAREREDIEDIIGDEGAARQMGLLINDILFQCQQAVLYMTSQQLYL